MTTTLRIVLSCTVFIYFIIVLRLLKEKKLALKYTLLWLLLGIIMIVFVIFPQLLSILGHLVGIVDSMNALFTFSISFVFVLVMALTSIVSKQSEKIKNLVQTCALMEKRIRELEKNEKSFIVDDDI